ncbi:MAG: DUF1786 family protein [Dehalococcoidia bacterium]
MRILSIDIGTGTQDILLYDSAGPIENSPKLVMPSPTKTAERRIRAATSAGRAVALSGVTAGGGPCHWALNDHMRAGFPAYATAGAARTFDDDLSKLEADGLTIVSDDELAGIDGEKIELRDLNVPAVMQALDAFGAETSIDGLAVGVLDHGAAPPEVSDRIFRFQHIERVLGTTPDVRAFAYLPDDLPAYLTRAQCVLGSIDVDVPTVFMDNGPAAALGALHDVEAAGVRCRFVLNAGNMHALGFVLNGTRIEAVFEHHTGEISSQRLAQMVAELCAGSLTNDDVFNTKGHGALYVGAPPFDPEIIAVTGPQRRAVLAELEAARAASPHGDMMISGCFGLLDGFAYRVPEAQEAVAQLHQLASS